MGHAYTKRQFKESGFDTTGYCFPTPKDSGDMCARLDCKKWGTHCMFLYLTMADDTKIITQVYKSSGDEPYMGFMDIPVGAILDTTFIHYIGETRGFISRAVWLKNETNLQEAEEHMNE